MTWYIYNIYIKWYDIHVIIYIYGIYIIFILTHNIYEENNLIKISRISRISSFLVIMILKNFR